MISLCFNHQETWQEAQFKQKQTPKPHMYTYLKNKQIEENKEKSVRNSFSVLVKYLTLTQ